MQRKVCFNKKVRRPVKDVLDQECLGGASVASVKEKYPPVNTKRDNNKARERRRDSSACLCGKFEVEMGLKGDHFSSRPQLCL